jgi:serine phosphatase RsbU (regulator of sigma subunit)
MPAATPKKVLVNNKHAHHKTIPASTHPKAMKADHQEIVLAPGFNEVSVAEWEEAKTLPVVKSWLEDEVLVEQENAKGEPLSDLGGLPAKKAIGIVKETFEVELLEKWRDGADPAVQKAIKAQLEKINAPAPGN